MIIFMQNTFRQILKWISEFYPKSKNVILIGIPNASFYNDNSKYFFEFLMKKNSPNLEIYLLTKNKKLYSTLKKRFENHLVYAFSFKALLTYFRAKFILISNGNDDIFPFYPSSKKQVVINMWHGNPIKKIGYLNAKPGEKINLDLNYFLVSSEAERDTIKRAFKDMFQKDQFKIFGIPRNDIFHNKRLEHKEKKTILYLPTFRENNSVNYFPFPDFDPNELRDFLKTNNIEIIIKPHKNDSTNQQLMDIIKANPYVKLKTSENKDIDIQHMLLDCDILLTDYSSVYFDFLLLDRPIIYLPYDYETYKNARGFLYDDFDEITCGDKVLTQKQFIQSIKANIENPEKDREIRAAVRNRFHQYTDGKASERLFNFIKNHP